MSTHMCLEKNNMNVIHKATAFSKRWKDAYRFRLCANTINRDAS